MDKAQTEVFSISDFLVKSFINKICHNSRTSTDIDMELRPITKLGQRNTTTPKKIDNDVAATNYYVIVVFPILEFSLITNFYLTKTENRIKD